MKREYWIDASMTGVESLERDQGGYKYIYMFMGSTCISMHRTIFMQKLLKSPTTWNSNLLRYT